LIFPFFPFLVFEGKMLCDGIEQDCGDRL